MAEITKITTPLMPKENTGNKYKPVSDQAFELTDLSRVHKSKQDKSIADREAGGQQAANLSRGMLQPLLRSASDLLGAVRKMAMLVELGVSAADAAANPQVKELLRLLYLPPQELLAAVQEQERASVLFKGESFTILRDLLARFEGNPRITASAVALLKAFEHNVNAPYSIRTILHSCNNILDYLFTADRAQFSAYLEGLSNMLLPPDDGAGQQAAAGSLPEAAPGQGTGAPLEMREAAQILKGNLLPLLGEIVVKYHQNERIRDIVMVVVHNIVRIDQGTPEALRDALQGLVQELRHVANVPPGFEDNLLQALFKDAASARQVQDSVMDRLAGIISETLRSPDANPATLRQAETLMMSLLQHQSAVMEVLHFVLPMQTPEGAVFAELYVDPDHDGAKGGRGGKRARKLFLTVESEVHGSFELSFLQAGERVDFSMWCPGVLVKSLSGLRRQIGDLMQLHGYTMNSFSVLEMTAPQSIAQVFPDLLNRRTAIDVRI